MLYFDEEEAVKKLQDLGYRVYKECFPEVENISTAKDLVEYFYQRRRFYNPERKYPLSINYKEDTKILSVFIRAREKLGLNRKQAIQESAMLIEAMFRYEEKFNLKEPIISPRILTHRIFVDRLCTFANGEVDLVNELETELFVNQINEIYEKRFSERDFKQAAIDRNEILERLNGNKNSKEGRERRT